MPRNRLNLESKGEVGRMHSPDANGRLDMLKALLPMMPQFLHKRRAGLPAVGSISEQLGIERPPLFTLIRISLVCGSYGGAPITREQFKGWDPYATVDVGAADLAGLVDKSLVLVEHDGRLSLSAGAQSAVDRLHEAGRAHVAALKPLPPGDLASLADLLEKAVAAVLANPALAPSPGSHLAGSRSVAVDDAPDMVRIEQAIYDLSLARDDAHMKAWRAAGLSGPAVAALSTLWAGGARTVDELIARLSPVQTPSDVERSLVSLVEHGYVVREGSGVRLTPEGASMRDGIERDTDRIYFASWPHTPEEIEWLRYKLRALVDNLPIAGGS